MRDVIATRSEDVSAEEDSRRFANAPVETLLAWVEERFGATAALASSFGLEDVVLIDLLTKHAPSVRIFTLDTGRLHPETYDVMEATRRRHGLTLLTYAPEHGALEALTSSQGYFSFRESVEQRKACCGVRKVEPLRRALEGRRAWLTGLRREQSVTRAEVPLVEVDAAHGGIFKVNPLAGWSEAQVRAYVKEHELPYNALHDQGFPSIGCAPCTRAIAADEDIRAGRWWWETPESRECGLHVGPDGKLSRNSEARAGEVQQ